MGSVTAKELGKEGMENSITDVHHLELLPTALMAIILMKLDDVSSICSVASTCKTLHTCASQVFSFIERFHLVDASPSANLLIHLLPPNPYLKTLKIDCSHLDDSAIVHLAQPSLHELSLYNCADFSGKLLAQIGRCCRGLRSLYLGSVAEKNCISKLSHTILLSDLEELLRECTKLETLVLMFGIPLSLDHDDFYRAWALASSNLTSLEIGYISSGMVTELLLYANHYNPPILPNIQKLCLSVDHITDTMVIAISNTLMSLTHLDLRDAPVSKPRLPFDLTNYGLHHINHRGKLKHLSLIRSHEFSVTDFTRINDLGVLLMADRCANIETISLGGFCRVTDTGFRAILHSCLNLYELRIFYGTQLTDLVFHDISATSLSLTHISLRWCSLLTNSTIACLANNSEIRVLDLRDCRSLGDEALASISQLPKLRTLLLDGWNITDEGVANLRLNCLVSLSLRGCKRLTDKCISAIFGGYFKPELEDLNLSNLPNLSDNGIFVLAKARVPIVELRLRHCRLIGDMSIMALASMQVDDEKWHGNRLRILDVYQCGGITALGFQWFKKPYFPHLRRLGVLGGKRRRDLVMALIQSRPFLKVAWCGEELGRSEWDNNMYGEEPERWGFEVDGDEQMEAED